MKVKLLVVTSNSMKPIFAFGDVLLAVSQEHYQPNDIICFTSNGTIVTHRIKCVRNFPKREDSTDVTALSELSDVIQATDDTVVTNVELSTEYQTRGDANTSADLGYISHERVLGKVKIIIPKIGYIVLFLQSRFVVITVIFAILFTLTAQLFFRKIKRYAK